MGGRAWRGAVRRVAVALLLAAAPAAAQEDLDGAAILAQLPSDLREHLLAQKVVLVARAESSTQSAQGYVIFEQPVERVFRLLSQTERQLEYRPELEAIETVAPLDDGTLDEHRIRILFLEVRYRLRNHRDEAHRRISWELDSAFENDLRRVEGSWELHALDARRTLGLFRTTVEVGSGIPSFLQDYLTRKNLPGTLERCRRWVDSDGRGD
jgi:hypothetical protein